MKRLRVLRVSVFVTLRVLVTLGLAAAPASAQPRLDGYATLMLDHLPSVEPSATELRARIFGELAVRASSIVELTVSGYADGLAADRGSSVYDAILKPQEALIALTFDRVDVQAGLGRVVWGRLDELQPGDVVNPLDVSRFFFEGRSEARLPVGLVRVRWFLTEGAVLEGVYVPFFRRGRFDQLDEPTSPFNLRPEGVESREPAKTLENGQGGVRFSGTVRRFDYALAAYRGFRPFGAVGAEPDGGRLRLVERFPRFTMVSGDFETVRGPWAFRGEADVFSEDEDPRPDALGGSPGISWDAGFAIDRKTGAYRLSGTVLVSRVRLQPDTTNNGENGLVASGFPPPPKASARLAEARSAREGGSRTTTSLIVGADRSFAQERYSTRVFGVVNVNDGSAFLRNITTITLRDNLVLEGSIGWFFDESADTIGRFADRDFLYARVKVYF
jgi:hypothetical protein